MKKIILASASERRSRILKECGIEHDVVVSDVEEIMDKDLHISEIVMANAEKKTDAVRKRHANSIILGADTLVAHGKDMIGKPSDENEARFILEKFSGSTVEVYTGICVLDGYNNGKITGFDKSVIYVDEIHGERLDTLFRLLGPYDKAGGFSIEGVGSMLFDRIEGSYFNILGLPMMKIKNMFEDLGLNIFDHITPKS